MQYTKLGFQSGFQVHLSLQVFVTVDRKLPLNPYSAYEAIIGALTLYLDFINLFLRLLRLFGKRK